MEVLMFLITVHVMNDDWIDIQLDRIHRFIPSARIYAGLDGHTAGHDFKFTFATHKRQEPKFKFKTRFEGSQDHWRRLNHLFEIVKQEGKSGDIVIFLDGDAFPIVPCENFIEKAVRDHKFVAVSYPGESRPHASFAATTIGFWSGIERGWVEGDYFHEGRRMWDLGGDVGPYLKENAPNWLKLFRTNKYNPHPEFFGIFGNLIYHHGAAFRSKCVSKNERARFKHSGLMRLVRAGNEAMSQEMFRLIKEKKDFHKLLLGCA